MSQEQVRIFLAGDSTVANCPEHEAPMAGWGQVLQSFFTERVIVHNKAMGGRSSNSFIEEGRWNSILETIKPNDYVCIQFGHNDQNDYLYGSDLMNIQIILMESKIIHIFARMGQGK